MFTTSISRRSFLSRLAAAGGAFGLAGFQRAPRTLRILILGGTGFIGPHQVQYALARGHQLTLFNRGRSVPDMYPELYRNLETLTGDRNGNLQALAGRKWDVVIDNSGYEPAQVRASADLLKDAVGRYLFVSTVAVYADRSIINQDEEAGPFGMLNVPEGQWKGYGPLKALCENEARAILGHRLTVVRPSVIVGPGDETDRFTYWLLRMERGGEVFAPGTPNDPIQFIDVRDVTGFMIHLLEADRGGAYNATGPAQPLTFGQLLEGMREVTKSTARMTWVAGDFLAARGLRGFSREVPMWMPPDGETAGQMRVSTKRGIAAGLNHRPLRATLTDLLAWCRSQPAERWAKMRVGLSAEQERELLAAWRAR